MFPKNGYNIDRVSNGRLLGDGVYHAMELGDSISYTRAASAYWPNSTMGRSICVAVNEIARVVPIKVTGYNVVPPSTVRPRYLVVQTSMKRAAPKPKEVVHIKGAVKYRGMHLASESKETDPVVEPFEVPEELPLWTRQDTNDDLEKIAISRPKELRKSSHSDEEYSSRKGGWFQRFRKKCNKSI